MLNVFVRELFKRFLDTWPCSAAASVTSGQIEVRNFTNFFYFYSCGRLATSWMVFMFLTLIIHAKTNRWMEHMYKICTLKFYNQVIQYILTSPKREFILLRTCKPFGNIKISVEIA